MIASFLAKPSLRLPLLAATVVATVATSAGPPWERTARTDARIVHLEPGASTDLTVAVDASHVPSVVARVEKLPSKGTLRIDAVDESAKCRTGATFTSAAGTWRTLDRLGASEEVQALELEGGCESGSAKSSTFVLHAENVGTTPLDFEWYAKAKIGGVDDDEPPEGSFVTVKPVE